MFTAAGMGLYLAAIFSLHVPYLIHVSMIKVSWPPNSLKKHANTSFEVLWINSGSKYWGFSCNPAALQCSSVMPVFCFCFKFNHLYLACTVGLVGYARNTTARNKRQLATRLFAVQAAKSVPTTFIKKRTKIVFPFFSSN